MAFFGSSFSALGRSLAMRLSPTQLRASPTAASSSILIQLINNNFFNGHQRHLLTPLRLKSGTKTNSGCKKRFRVRGGGSIKRGRSGASHNTGYKTRQRVNRLGSSTGVEGKAIEQRVRRLLGVSVRG